MKMIVSKEAWMMEMWKCLLFASCKIVLVLLVFGGIGGSWLRDFRRITLTEAPSSHRNRPALTTKLTVYTNFNLGYWEASFKKCMGGPLKTNNTWDYISQPQRAERGVTLFSAVFRVQFRQETRCWDVREASFMLWWHREGRAIKVN